MSAKKTRENGVSSCCFEGINFFVPNRTLSKLYLRLMPHFSATDDDFGFALPLATGIPTAYL